MRPESGRRVSWQGLQDLLVPMDRERLLAVQEGQSLILLGQVGTRPGPARPLVVQAGQILRPGERVATQRLQVQTLAALGDLRH
jgi:hypothetical protein